MLRPVRMRSDAFGCVRMHLDAFGCVPRRPEKFGNFVPKNAIFSKCSYVFFSKVSDLFGPVRMCSDAFGCIWMRSDAFGHFRKISKNFDEWRSQVTSVKD